MPRTFSSDKEAADALVSSYQALKSEIGKVIIGQDDVVRSVIISVFCKGHCLLVGVPGLAKTLLVNTIAQVLGLTYNRIQFTPDLMPSDITGTEILDENRQFKFIRGPLFANIILADEINRTPPKTQSALLEAMQEYAVTTAGKRYELSKPFFVLATQNPIEQEGTYPLPEAQLDRFMFNVLLDYPRYEEEVQVVKNTTSGQSAVLNKILDGEDISVFQDLIRKIPISDNVLKYAVSLASNSRPAYAGAPEKIRTYVSWGAGPRASQYLVLGAKCNAVFNGKYSPDIEDVQQVASAILRHRIVRNYRAEADGVSIEDLISELILKGGV